MDPMCDEDFVELFERCSIPNQGFHHREHIRVAWFYLRRHDFNTGSDLMIAGIRRFAEFHGLAKLYHETITRFWLVAVEQALQLRPTADSFEAFLVANPNLADSKFIYRFYSKDRLMSDKARTEWVEPDLMQLPCTKKRAADLAAHRMIV